MNKYGRSVRGKEGLLGPAGIKKPFGKSFCIIKVVRTLFENFIATLKTKTHFSTRKGHEMNILWIVFIGWLLCELILWGRGHETFFLLDTLPFSNPSRGLSLSYTLAALAMLYILARGLKKLSKNGGGK